MPDEAVIAVMKRPAEIIVVTGRFPDDVRIRSYLKVLTENDIPERDSYIEGRKQLLRSLVHRQGISSASESAIAILNPTSEMSVGEYLQLVNSHRIKVRGFRFKSHPEGGGFYVAPKDSENPYPSDCIADTERIVRPMRGDDYVLVHGIIGIKVSATAEELERFQRDSRVMLVDVGPVDVVQSYQEKNVYVVGVEWDYLLEHLPAERWQA